MLLPELSSYGIMVVMEDSGKATGNACCYIKGTANHNDVLIPCVAVVWIGDKKSVEDDRNVLAAAGLCLHSIKAFSICHAALQARSLGVQEKLGGGTARTADLS